MIKIFILLALLNYLVVCIHLYFKNYILAAFNLIMATLSALMILYYI